MQPGDAVAVNDSFDGSTRAPRTFVFRPIRRRGMGFGAAPATPSNDTEQRHIVFVHRMVALFERGRGDHGTPNLQTQRHPDRAARHPVAAGGHGRPRAQYRDGARVLSRADREASPARRGASVPGHRPPATGRAGHGGRNHGDHARAGGGVRAGRLHRHSRCQRDCDAHQDRPPLRARTTGPNDGGGRQSRQCRRSVLRRNVQRGHHRNSRRRRQRREPLWGSAWSRPCEVGSRPCTSRDGSWMRRVFSSTGS